MASAFTVVTRKGQITIPAPIRKALGIAVGDRIEVIFPNGDEQQATIRRVPSVVDATYGIAKWTGEPIDVADYARAVEAEILDEYRRDLETQDLSR